MSKVYEHFNQYGELEEEPMIEDKPKISNSDFLDLSCELSSTIIEDMCREFGMDSKYLKESNNEGRYTDQGQEVFNAYYDLFQHILRKYLEEVR